MKTFQYGNARITNNNEGLRISIPSRKTWLLLIFGTLWLGGWAFGLSTVLDLAMAGDSGLEGFDVFLAVWLSLWTLGGLSIICLLLWGYLGKEELYIPKNKREIIFKKHILGLGLTRQLDKNQIRNFRFHEVSAALMSMRRGLAMWGAGAGKIKFDYGMKTFSMGLGLDDAEANYIIYLLDDTLG